MDKQELLKEIGELPLFEKREIKVKKSDTSDEWVNSPGNSAICDVKGCEPFAFVKDRYQVIQFKDVFKPVLDSNDGEVDGRIINFKGFAAMTLFPKDQSLIVNGAKIGMVAINSVDCSSAVLVKFCIKKNGHYLTMPRKVAGIKNTHTKNASKLVQDFMKMVGPVKTAWTHIVEEFPKYKIVKDEPTEAEIEASDYPIYTFDSVAGDLGFGPRMMKKLSGKLDKALLLNRDYTLWTMFTDALYIISSKNYKSEVHKQKNIDKLCDAVFQTSLVASI